MKKIDLSGNPLKPVSFAGLILVLIISWGIIFSALIWRGPAEERALRNTFAGSLREYDQFNAPGMVLAGENPDLIERRLARLQPKSVEEHLSVLKRRRALALIDRNYIAGYAKAATEAAELFAYSGPLAAVAAEAVVLGGGSSAEDLLKNYAGRMSQNRFGMLELSLHVLAGNLESPASAAAIPSLLLSMDLSGFPPQVQRDLETNVFLLLAYRGDIPAASFKLDSLLVYPSPEIIRMGAEFFYDHQNPFRAAELFLSLPEET